MHPFLAYLAAAIVTKLPPPGLWDRFVRWLLWGEHAQQSYYSRLILRGPHGVRNNFGAGERPRVGSRTS
jgi:hypothetical protein